MWGSFEALRTWPVVLHAAEVDLLYQPLSKQSGNEKRVQEYRQQDVQKTETRVITLFEADLKAL